MEDAISDLHYILVFANAAQQQIKRGEKPTIGYLNRMTELANKVSRQFDPSFEEWCDVESRR